ncbi:GNAT family N-acetyltransferase [Pinisolibacter aquiterrae]|uniref:GNAT family N-acetyltransferase n=1 Tax=Pinisolibacter aquiterrae TaxID=2815579 RepID=UPI001C3C2BEA|nr:GNAT family N-acetyltransferase [Pinisolibacter aquiterrae]MCC8237086.1 GNAT family N-acetyltransferase [Pinisolibacter aquiterrae]
MTASIASTDVALSTRIIAALRRIGTRGFAADLLAMGSAQIVIRLSRLAATIALARLLMPEDLGRAAVVLTVYELVALMTRNGIAAKVVQAAPDRVEAVAETAQALTWIVCTGLMVLQIALAVPVAAAFGDESLALPIAAMAPIYLASPLSNIQSAFLQREGRVRRIALAGAVQVVVDNILTTILALAGLGLWAIVLPKLLVAPIWVGFLRWGHAWRPQRPFGLGRGLTGAADILRFGRSVLGVELMTTLQANVDNLLVGWFLGAEALGIYYFAFNAGLGISLGLVNAFGIAVFPHLCAAGGDGGELRRRFRSTLRTLALLVVPLVLAQVLLAPIYVPLVFGDRWEPAIPVLMVICLSALPRPFASATSQLLKAVGRPEIELRWQTALTAVLVVALLAATQIGIFAVAVAVLVVQIVVLAAFCVIVPPTVLPPVAPPTSEAGATRRFEVVTDEAGLDALRPQWEALWARVPEARVSQGFDWCRTGWERTARPRGRRLWVVVLREGDELRLVWPLVLASRRGHTVALGLGSESTEYDQILVAPGATESDDLAAAHRFVRDSCPADVIEIGFVRAASARARAIAEDGLPRRAHPIPAFMRALRPFPSTEAHLAALPGKLRTELGRRRRHFEARGTFTSGIVDDVGEARRAIDWAIARKSDWLRRRGEANAFLATAEYRAFLHALAGRAGACGRLVVMACALDDRFVAVKIGTVDRRRFEGFVTVYDPAFHTLAPGNLLLAECFAECIAEGLDYDFRIGDEPYKQVWATDGETVTRWEIANGARGRVVLFTRAGLDALTRGRDRLRRCLPVVWRRRLKALVTGGRPLAAPAVEASGGLGEPA